MRYYREIRTKTGRACILRSPAAKDAEKILAHMRLTSGETDYMLRYPDEITLPVKDERALLERIAASSNEVMIAAEIDGKLVANAGFSPVLPCEKARHRAEFGISVQRAYWGEGIGSAILEGILDSARRAGYRQMELDVVSDNERGVALYRKFGFRAYGTLEHACLLRDGSWQTLYRMACRL